MNKILSIFPSLKFVNSHSFTRRDRRVAFTLAEVLITLGVIGVVSAITMPTLIQNHRKQEVIVKLKHASSILQQVSNMAFAEYGDEAQQDLSNLPDGDADAAFEKFNKYFVPYIKFTKVEKTEKGLFAYLANGSVMYYRKYPGPNNTFIILCMNKKSCNSDFDNNGSYETVNGKDTFSLYRTGKIPTWSLQTYTHQQLIEQCKDKTNHEACLSLIVEAGWKIPKDYPIRF